MCVICHAAKKRHMKRLEMIQAMKSNPAGFFLAALHPGGKRNTLRTLDEKEALAFFDNEVKDDDAFVMHARIPSYGPRTLDNVHGWESDGILFMHNMSLRNLDGFRDKFSDWRDRTDSEFFFKKLFIPFYRGYGKEAYKDGNLHEDICKFVDWICGTSNRFLFVMPDNKVVRFGTWVNEPDRKEGDEIAFWASNSSYKTFERTWPAYEQGGSPQSGNSFRRDFDPDPDPDYGDYPDWRASHHGCESRTAPSAGTLNSAWDDDAGQTLRNMVGDAQVVRLALADMVSRNLVEARSVIEIQGEGAAAEALETLLPDAFNDRTFDTVCECLEMLVDEMLVDCPDGIETFVASYADDIQRRLATTGNNGILPAFVGEDRIRAGLDQLCGEFQTFKRVANLAIDWNAAADRFACAFYLTRTRTGSPKMEKIDPIDLIGTASCPYGDAEEAVNTLLDAARKGDKGAKT